MEYTVEKIAQLVGGEVHGDQSTIIGGVAKIEEADSDSLCFISNKKYQHYLETTSAAAVIVGKDIQNLPSNKTCIICEDPYVAFTKVLITFFDYKSPHTGIHASATIEEDVELGSNVYIGPNVYIASGCKIGAGSKIYANSSIYENCSVGDNTTIYSNVSVYYGCSIGSNTIIHSGTVIGSDGFGHAPMPNGTFIKIPQIGNVVIEDNVEVGSNCSIDRANMGSTIISEGCRIDNLIQIAHGVKIGKNTVVAAQAGISGSTTVGENCIIAGQVGIVGHISIADRVQIGAQSGVSNSIKETGGKFTDSPHLPLSQAIRSRVIYKNLPELEKRITRLEQQNTAEK
ncbi:UDP-3-O-(3-hydroxymyristoyl)glucosamine N-acyltransferase [bacterium]|nr:UDP-3-O-(3-hydroxymyristoyl)glucosamine N-acyltransferase [bacterium]